MNARRKDIMFCVILCLEDCSVTFMQDRIHAGQLYFSTYARVQLDRNKFFKAQRLNANSWPPPFHPYIKKTTNTVTIVCPPYFRPHGVGCMAQNDHFMLTQACRWVLGHKFPCLHHLYKPIRSKINQNLNNSPKNN